MVRARRSPAIFLPARFERSHPYRGGAMIDGRITQGAQVNGIVQLVITHKGNRRFTTAPALIDEFDIISVAALIGDEAGLVAYMGLRTLGEAKLIRAPLIRIGLAMDCRTQLMAS